MEDNDLIITCQLRVCALEDHNHIKCDAQVITCCSHVNSEIKLCSTSDFCKHRYSHDVKLKIGNDMLPYITRNLF